WTGHEQIDADNLLAFEDIWGQANDDDQSDSEPPIVGVDESFQGHGTAMSAIIAGSGSGNPDLKGVAPEVKLVGVRWTRGWWSDGVYANALDAFEWVGENAETYGIDILSFSGGFYRSSTDRDYYEGNGMYSDTLTRLADELFTQEGVIVVSAAGNEGINDVVKSPSSGKHVICVGAVADPSEGGWGLYYVNDDTGSSIGPVNYLDTTLPANPDWYKPDVVAPGVDIETAGWSVSGNPKASDSYRDDWTGTSPATAFVSGLIALYLDYDIELALDNDGDGNPDVKQLLWASAIEINEPVAGDTPAAGIDKYYGAGRVDGVAGLDFLTTDISSTHTYPKVISDYYMGYNEPMWRLDPLFNRDWYKYTSYASAHFSIFVYTDPDLMVEVHLYKLLSSCLHLVSQDISTIRGDDCSISYSGTSGTYYVLVRLTGSYGSMGFPGDYYDIQIDITSA
ncbi:MAG: S8 family serine peptidase, partial [Candidatus Thorarchaeota archaeon]